jgi:hypothetical protein
MNRPLLVILIASNRIKGLVNTHPAEAFAWLNYPSPFHPDKINLSAHSQNFLKDVLAAVLQVQIPIFFSDFLRKLFKIILVWKVSKAPNFPQNYGSKML